MFSEYLDEIKATKTENTWKNYCASLKKFKEGTPEEIKAFIADPSMKSTTKKLHLRILLLALHWYGKDTREIERLIKGYKENKPVQPCPTPEEIEKVWKYLETHRNRAMFALMAYNGLRIGEVVNLDVDDVDMVKKQITLYGTKGKRDSIVPLVHPRVINELRQYLKERNEKHTISAALFLSATGKRVSTIRVEKLFKTEFNDNGLDYHCHSLRRFFANTLDKHGIPVQQISAAMRHSSITTTMQYLNIGSDDTRKVLSKVYGG